MLSWLWQSMQATFSPTPGGPNSDRLRCAQNAGIKIPDKITNNFQLYGGYWFHEVGAVLDNPNWILSKLGYASTRESEHIWELSPDISVETLGEIHWASLDCFVAAVECQVRDKFLLSLADFFKDRKLE
jgi:hypothetical protein